MLWGEYMDKIEKKESGKVVRIVSTIVLYSFILPIGFLIFKIVNPEFGTDELARKIKRLIRC